MDDDVSHLNDFTRCFQTDVSSDYATVCLAAMLAYFVEYCPRNLLRICRTPPRMSGNVTWTAIKHVHNVKFRLS